MTEGSFGRRMTALAAVIAFAFAALVTRLWFLQVLAADEYQGRAETNRIRLVPVSAPRGWILDRHGEPLVSNEQAIILTVDRTKVEDEDALLASLSDLLHVPVHQLETRLNDPTYLPYQPIPIADRVPKPVAIETQLHKDEFPGVDYQVVGARSYVHGPLAPHLLGYLNEITGEELADPSFTGYLPGQLVGRGGVEQYYEHFLRGEDGWKKLEVDASGTVLDTIGSQAPVPGSDVYLSLDWKIQDLAQQTLADAIGQARQTVVGENGSFVKAAAGAVVVMDPDNGHVLAMSSFPTYDPRKFLGGVTEREWRVLNSPSRNYPLNNRALLGYPPGSTFKPFVAAAALKAGYANLTSTYPCPPDFKVLGDQSGTVFHNWTDADLGSLNLAQALIQSCDTVFYGFGLDFYVDRDVRGDYMQAQLRRWGFGSEGGIDIPGEQDGRIPDPRWKEQVNELWPNLFPDDIWFPGDNINMSVGQGDVLVSPLQLAVAYGAIANGGTLYRPQVGMKIVAPDGDVVKRLERRAIGHVPASPQTLAFLRTALQGVVQPGGTAATAFGGWNHIQYPVAGKTGTAEVDTSHGTVNHSWFAAMAPADDPEYVVVALVEEGGHGSEVAAPIVRTILEGLFDIESDGVTISSQAVD